jgi:signal transduction histidine kinase
VSLPWLRPASAPLLALTDARPDPDALRADPALVLHLIRYIRPTPTADTFALDDATVFQPGPLDTAAELLDRFPELPPLDPHSPTVIAGQALAEAASAIAARTGHCSPDAAWAAGLLAFLGEYASSLVPHGRGEQSPDRTPSQLARRLAGRWRLPAWLTVAIGFPELAPAQAAKLGGHFGLTAVLKEARSQTPAWKRVPDEGNSAEPLGLLPRLLRATAAARRRSAEPLVAELESCIDGLAAALADTDAHFDDTLRTAKLAALAEFAAGASHEINNPLAVISGNVQRVLARETDAGNRDALAVALKQTKRIQELLQGTRQFARPPQPHRETVELSAVVAEVLRDLSAEADAGRVSVAAEPTGATAFADPKHIRAAVAQLLRNALDAAGERGWVQIGYATAGDVVSILIDDSGLGPPDDAVPHLFDPFYSGRAAGRGRGLGLSIAWRLATQNGGDLHFTPRPGLPTRFVLTLPASGELRLFQSA